LNAFAAPVDRLRSVSVRLPWLLVGLGALVVLSVLLRITGIHGRFWIDEGLSVGMSSHRFGDIPSLLRQDGSPPLYYLLLHVWMSIAGSGEADTHALSLGFALATVPAAFLAALSLFGRRAAWIGAALAATTPFLTFYAQETRMYALVAFLGLVVAGTFLLAFVQRRRVWLVPFAASLLALIYAHNWGLFLAAGTLAALVPTAMVAADRRAVVRDAAWAYGAVALLYLPWLPSLAFQAAHTGAPWSTAPGIDQLLQGVTSVLGGPAAAIALALGGGGGLAGLVSFDPRRVLADPSDPAARRRTAVVALCTMALAALLLAFLASQISPAWANRYFAVLLGPLLLLGAAGLATSGRLGIVALVFIAILWMHPKTAAVNNKSDVHHVVVVARPSLQPGDLVLSTHPEQLPVLRYYLGPGFRYANGIGTVRDPTIMDWRDAMARFQRAHPTPTERLLTRGLRPGQQVLLVVPIVRTGSWKAPWTALVRRRSNQWERVMNRDPRMARVGAIPHFLHTQLPRGVRTVLYRVS
jgi:mannosyltransferase